METPCFYSSPEWTNQTMAPEWAFQVLSENVEYKLVFKI